MIASTSSSPHVSEQLAHNLVFLISKERFRLGRDPTMASKQLNCSLACPTQVVLKHETRCLNVKFLNFSGLALKHKISLETQRGRSKCVPEGEGDGKEEGEGDGTAPTNGGCHENPRSNR